MSRIGKLPIPLSSKVKVSFEADRVTVKGPRGSLERKIPPEIEVRIEDDQIWVTRAVETRHWRAMNGLFRNLVANMVCGVTEGFSRTLQIQGVGYRAEVKGDILHLSLGFSHPVRRKIPKGIEIKVDKQNIIINGIDKELVGLTAAQIREIRPPEPYKGKGIRYLDETVRRKVGKTGAK